MCVCTRACICFCVGHGPISAEVCVQMGRFTPSLWLPSIHSNFPSPCPWNVGPHIRFQLKSLKHFVLDHLAIPLAPLWATPQDALRYHFLGHRKQALGRPLVSTPGKHPRVAHSSLSISRTPGLGWIHHFLQSLSSGILGLQPTPKPSSHTSPHKAWELSYWPKSKTANTNK